MFRIRGPLNEKGGRTGDAADALRVEHDGLGRELVQQLVDLLLAALAGGGEGVRHERVKVGLARAGDH
eukprot:1187767-Prorocentrum_minimum.AAC.2